MSIEVFFDGASRGNPGKVGYGGYIKSDNLKQEFGGYHPYETNNFAEYMGLISALEALVNFCSSNQCDNIIIYGDSRLVIKQMRNEWQVKHPKLIGLYKAAKKIEKKLPRINYKYIPRTKNSLADKIANKFCDKN